MEINLKFNFWSTIWIIVVAFTILFFTILTTKLVIIQGELDIKQTELTQPNIKWIYQCNKYESNLWQCQNPTLNITGHYCNGTIVCKNEYEVLK